MCGTVGLFLKDRALEPQLGSLLGGMLVTMSDRGPDSAGFAVYGSATSDTIKLTIRTEQLELRRHPAPPSGRRTVAALRRARHPVEPQCAAPRADQRGLSFQTMGPPIAHRTSEFVKSSGGDGPGCATPIAATITVRTASLRVMLIAPSGK